MPLIYIYIDKRDGHINWQRRCWGPQSKSIKSGSVLGGVPMSELRSCLTTRAASCCHSASVLPQMRSRCWSLAFAVLAYASGTGLSVAGPDRCVLGPNPPPSALSSALCTGNQSTGVRENPPGLASDFPTGTAHLTVRDLTRDIVTDVIGIKFSFTNTATPTGFLEYTGGNTTLNAGNIGIAMGKVGRPGAAGQPGETWTSATIRSFGTIQSRLAGINLTVSGGAGGGGQDAGHSGQPGGAGATLDVQGSGRITTSGIGGPGILLSATGGNGANGRGRAFFGNAAGNGGAGGVGSGGVLLSPRLGDWTIETTAAGPSANAPGIRIQVAGGNGGNGGDASGGSGGGGGNGGNGVTNGIVIGTLGSGAWTITTQGGNSDAISVSARGGNAGNSSDQNLGTGPVGRSGGNSGDIRAWLSGGTLTATTRGNNSAGVRLETTGGNGGNGGVGGGAGGGGGFGGSGSGITLGGANFAAQLSTQGDLSPGVLLHSRGGNGGQGAASAGTGGDGGAGDSGAILTVRGQYTIDTKGDTSDGIAALSFGGTSGRGGNGVFGRPGGSDQTRQSAPVTVDVTGSITTSGNNSSGIDAESIAGYGGGTGTSFFGFSATAGSAGLGGNVTVTNGARITTRGDQSTAITAASIGGGGGIGGPSFGLYWAQGSAGGIGGDGGIVGVTNSGNLATAGDDAAGIFAQSVGGNGGSGGIGLSVIAAFGGKSQFGGSGGPVTVINSGAIQTGLNQGSFRPNPLAARDPICGSGCSAGIFAQSVGGGGGNAGAAGSPLFSLGANGGQGGNGGAVTVTNVADQGSDTITTALDDSDAITAQSVGGGGGTGGGAVSVNPGLGVSAAVGGNGGSGGNGGTVFVSNASPRLVTRGDQSRGITAQSIGGGGGDSGFAVSVAAGANVPAVAIAVGGSSRAAGRGGVVSVGSSADIFTDGIDSAGIYAQSVGGGGGTGGFAVAASGSNLGAVSVGVGGRGGAGGDGASVAVTSAARSDIDTEGDNSSGIFAQSIGGGGGNGGVSIAAAAAQAGATFSVGGAGGSGGNAGDVSVRDDGDTIHTRGINSDGISAQSIANSGGNGGLALSVAAGRQVGALAFAMGGAGAAGGVGGTVTLNNRARILTDGDSSTGVFAQSVGGGGGNGGMSVAGGLLTSPTGRGSMQISVGGGAGNGGRASSVFVTNDGNITAKGDGSMGIAAQSVGKGGGTGGMSFAGQIGGVGGSSGVLNLSLGGNGGVGGDAGAVTVGNTGNIQTAGATVGTRPAFNPNAAPCKQPPCVKQYGISAQSVGGGGGTGGLAGTLQLAPFAANQSGYSLSLNTAVGGKGGAAGRGGEVRVTNSGAVSTLAGESSAIFAQSVSGGGGDGGQAIAYRIQPGQPEKISSISSTITVGGQGGSGQIGGRVTIDNTGALSTKEYASHGMFAQSVGGGGGNGGDTGSFQLTVTCVRGTSVPCDGQADSTGSWSLTTKIGGAGGTGNHGGVVTVTNAADITTTGGGSDAIRAASIGGGGGSGGNDSGLTGLPSSIPFITGDRQTRFRSLDIAVGGNGGAQGDGSDVSVTQNGNDLQTTGGGASGIVAQSVGGGGGMSKGGTVSATGTKPAVSVGGQGGAGGNGGAVTVNVLNSADIDTSGVAVVDRNGKPVTSAGCVRHLCAKRRWRRRRRRLIPVAGYPGRWTDSGLRLVQPGQHRHGVADHRRRRRGRQRRRGDRESQRLHRDRQLKGPRRKLAGNPGAERRRWRRYRRLHRDQPDWSSQPGRRLPRDVHG